MYVKLAWRNARKYLREYLIYCITLTLCVGMFYAFMSLFSRYYVSSLPIQYDMSTMREYLWLPVIIITFLIVFLIRYANRYVLKRKQKQLAIQILLGIEQKHAAYLFFLETLICGLIAIGAGIIAGTVFSQFLTAYIMNFYGEPYQMYFSLYPDTILVSILAFLIIYTIIGGMNVKTIQRMKIVELLHADKQMNGDMKKEYLMPVLMLVYCVISAVLISNTWMVVTACASALVLYERMILIANIILPILFVGVILVKIMKSIKERRFFPLHKSLLVTSVISLLLVVTTLLVVTGHPDLGSRLSNQFYIFTILFVVYLLFSFFYAASYSMQIFSQRSKRWKYQENHLFLLRQITSKLTVTSRTMSLLASCIMAAIIIFTISPILTGWVLGFLDLRAVYDVQAEGRYTSVNEKYMGQPGDFGYVDDICNSYGVSYADSALIELYFLPESDCSEDEGEYVDATILMGISDYNHMRRMAGYDEITLGQDEYTIQWYCQVKDSLVDEYILNHPNLKIGDTSLKLAKDCRYKEKMGEVIYSFETMSVLIVPDEICDRLVMGSYVYLADFKDTIPYATSEKILAEIHQKQLSMRKQGVRSDIRMRTIQRNQGISVGLAMKLMFVYSAFMLLIITFTILSLQQLEDSTDYRQRYDIIRKLGVPEREIQKLILQQMAVWFLLPIVLGGICGRVIGQFYYQWCSENLSAYVNIHEIQSVMLESVFIVGILLCCYFLATWTMFVGNMRTRAGRGE